MSHPMWVPRHEFGSSHGVMETGRCLWSEELGHWDMCWVCFILALPVAVCLQATIRWVALLYYGLLAMELCLTMAGPETRARDHGLKPLRP